MVAVLTAMLITVKDSSNAFYLKGLNDASHMGTRQHQTNMLQKVAALESLRDAMDMNGAECHRGESGKRKPWFDEGCSVLLHQRKGIEANESEVIRILQDTKL
jgi:hypothetical protein